MLTAIFKAEMCFNRVDGDSGHFRLIRHRFSAKVYHLYFKRLDGGAPCSCHIYCAAEHRSGGTGDGNGRAGTGPVETDAGRRLIGWRAEGCYTTSTRVCSARCRAVWWHSGTPKRGIGGGVGSATDEPAYARAPSSRARLNWGSWRGFYSRGRRMCHRTTWRGTWVSRSRTRRLCGGHEATADAARWLRQCWAADHLGD